MMWGWGYVPNMGWMWLWGLLMLVDAGLLVLLAVRMFSGGPGRGGPPGFGGPGPGTPGGPSQARSSARLILDERFAKGELTEEQYRQHLKVLGEDT